MTTNRIGSARVLACLSGFRAVVLGAVSVGVVFSAPAIWSQQPATDENQKSQLGEQQRLVERKMAELESKFTAIALQIQEAEPERAKRLIEAYQQAKEQLLTQRMADVAKLLDENQLDKAQAKLDEVIVALNELVKLLLNQKDSGLSKQQEIEMLQQWKESIQNMQREQKSQRQETEKVANKEDTLKKLDEQIKKLDELIGRQEGVIQQTEQNKDQGLQALDRVADEQFDIRKQTQALERDIAGDEANNKTPNKANEGGAPANPPASDDQKPSSDQPADKPASEKPPTDIPPSDKPSSDQPSADKPTDKQAGDSAGKPSNQKPGESGEPKPGQPSEQQPEPPKPGQRPLQNANQAQERAEEKLASGKAADAQRQQEKAVDDMKAARNELEKERRRIASLPPEALEQLSQAQRRLKDKAMDLAKKMDNAPKPKTADGQDPNASQGQKQPGQQQVQQAGDQMQKAAKDLGDQDAQQAERKQRDAEQKLQQALDEIEERLNQLREETREEKLKRLEARFREMLERQKIASVMTIELNDKRTNLGSFKRRDQLLVLRLATDESEISELGQQAYDLLLEDGTSVVFPEVVQDLRVDLTRVGELLASERTDQLTQLIQREIEATLQELLDALKDTQKNGGGGGGGGGGGKQPLLKKSAELKMLRAAQLRVNRQTKQLDAIRTARDLDTELETEVKTIGRRQSDLLKMAEQIMDKEGDQ